jgi:YD repeat-containing protein
VAKRSSSFCLEPPRRPASHPHVTEPSVPDPVLVQNIYDQYRPGYYNVGQLTTSQNSAATHLMDWHPSGNLARRATTIGGKTYTRTDFEDRGQRPIHTTYQGDGAGTTLEIGIPSSHWTYTQDGLLKTVPGYVTGTQYEADKQTRSIAYANGVTTSFTYSPQRRWLTGFETKQANGTVLLKGSYTRDNAGRILSTGRGSPTTGSIPASISTSCSPPTMPATMRSTRRSSTPPPAT